MIRKQRLKILIIQEVIPHYRVPVFNALSSIYNLTVVASLFDNPDSYRFKTDKVEFRKLGPFWYSRHLSKMNLNIYDVVIFVHNIRHLNLYEILFKKNNNYKTIFWGIGLSSEVGFDTNKKYDKIRFWTAKKADAMIFYSKAPISSYVEGGVEKKKLFVANNTLDITPSVSGLVKEYFVFVGTLKKYKRIDNLIDIYYRALIQFPELPSLHIVGDGPYMKNLVAQIERLGLKEKTVLHGSVTDDEKLKEIYGNAIASLSPAQAGLSVLQSLAKGVPYITNHDAITGGERFNIIDGYNGFLSLSDDHFVDILIELATNRELVERLSINSYDYFNKNCSIKSMVLGFENAISYVLTCKK